MSVSLAMLGDADPAVRAEAASSNGPTRHQTRTSGGIPRFVGATTALNDSVATIDVIF